MMSNSFERGIYRGDLLSLVPTLKIWQGIVERTAKAWVKDGDTPWWYTERASLSMFAGAIWLNQGFAFEEYSVYRKVGSKPGAKYRNGRCDIEFNLKHQYYVAEAKHCWPTLGQSKQNATPMVQSRLEQAESEVAQVWESGYHSLAIVFATPRIPVKHESEMEENILEFVAQVKELKKTTVAWVFPKVTRQLRPPKTSKNHNIIYPGLIVALRSCKKQ
jgi:hypothetical protein